MPHPDVTTIRRQIRHTQTISQQHIQKVTELGQKVTELTAKSNRVNSKK